MKFSVCLSTQNIDYSFLSSFLTMLENDSIIDEVLIFSSNVDEINKTHDLSCFQSSKIISFVSPTRLDPLSVKIKAGLLAKNDWIALFDSIDLPDKTFFENSLKYIVQNNIWEKPALLAPCYAKPHHLFHNVVGKKFTRKNLHSTISNQILTNVHPNHQLTTLLHLGNFIVSKSVFTKLDVSSVKDLLSDSIAYDSILFNCLCFEQIHEIELHIVSGMEYTNKFNEKKTEAMKLEASDKIMKKLQERLIASCIPEKTNTTLKNFGIDNDIISYGIEHLIPNKNSVIYSFGCGENILHAVQMAKHLGACVHLFDPSPEAVKHAIYIRNTFQLLERQSDKSDKLYTKICADSSYMNNIIENNVHSSKIQIHNTALGLEDKDFVRFYQLNDSSNFSLIEPSQKKGHILIKTQKLTTIMKELDHKKIDFLKLDVGEIGADILLQMFDEDNIYPNCLSIRFSMQDFANSDQCAKEELERKYTSIILKIIEKGYQLCATNTGSVFERPYTFLYQQAKGT